MHKINTQTHYVSEAIIFQAQNSNFQVLFKENW